MRSSEDSRVDGTSEADLRSPRVAVLVAALMVIVSCTSAPSGGCLEPPASEQARVSDLELSIEPSPATSGGVATLALGNSDLPDDAVASEGIEWQCWDGARWVGTHQLLRGGPTFPVEPGVTTTVSAVGLPIPNSYEIVVPEVPAGLYRIQDSIHLGPDVIVTGFVLVQVGPEQP
jgi:hypothetical protein